MPATLTSPLPWLTPARLDAWRALCCTAPGRETLTVTIPRTGAPLPPVPRGTADDVRAAVARARAAQGAWAARSARDRARVLLAFHGRVLARQHEALDLVQLETGKARLDAFEEVADTANVARHYGIHAPAMLADRRRGGALPVLTRTLERRRPRGVVGFIVPWNYPLTLAATDALAAIVAGNAVVLRPDPQTTLTALWTAEQFRESGLPPDVFMIVTGEGPEIGPPLIEAVDSVMFTGSTATGRRIAAGAAARLLDVSLELGGKNPMIVRADADLDRAVTGAVRGCFVGAGQVCVSIERIVVAAPMAARFLKTFAARTRALTFSTTLDWPGEVGSLTNARQLERVVAHVEDARAKGATVLAGGRHRPDVGPLFYEPTILTGVTPGMLPYADETFGPVVSVYPVASDDEAVALANATAYGLNASVWTRDLRAGHALAARIEVGTVNLNDTYAATWGSVDAPIGGMKDSGLGRRHGREGLLKFTEVQTIAEQRWLALAPPRGMTSERWARLLTLALRLRRFIPGIR